MKQITRISPAVLTGITNNIPEYAYNEEIIVGADATRYRNGDAELSCLMGLGTQAGTNNQVVIGKYNAISTDALFVIGSGTSTNAKKNIVEVKNNKVIINEDLSVGNNLTVNETLKVKTIEGTMSLTASTIKSNSITATRIQSSELITASKIQSNSIVKDNGEAYTTISEVQNITGLKNYMTTAHLNIIFGNYYLKVEMDEKINDLDKDIEDCYSWFDLQMNANSQRLNEIEGRLNETRTLINQLCEAVIWLGKNPTTPKEFGFIA